MNFVSTDRLKEILKELKENTVIYCGGDCVELNPGSYWEVRGIEIVLERIIKDEPMFNKENEELLEE